MEFVKFASLISSIPFSQWLTDSATTPPTASPQGAAILVTHENRLAGGQALDASHFKGIAIVEPDQRHLVAHLG